VSNFKSESGVNTERGKIRYTFVEYSALICMYNVHCTYVKQLNNAPQKDELRDDKNKKSNGTGAKMVAVNLLDVYICMTCMQMSI